MSLSATFLVLGATCGTLKHLVSQVLADGHRVRALVRTPEKLARLSGDNKHLDVWRGSITDDTIDTDGLVTGVAYAVSILEDVDAQRSAKINTAFVKKAGPIDEMTWRARSSVTGRKVKPTVSGTAFSTALWTTRYTFARGYAGRHEDSEVVMEYLATEAGDLEWIVHRAGIDSDGDSEGVLQRSKTRFSVPII
ncbi:hypothetical protein B0A55_07274 [Friedmanniomyces simplex]|uniref:NAD(P)-binding domain-containing protein n=1 Tax=Friedmanniomyces simplex TaxID=329884 RepID=A0A4U0X639_9PEZI|nr:hypothetical protein B0A55_07274 [Friedmanniomyces simplex]